MEMKVGKIVPKGYVGITLWPFGIYVSAKKYLSSLIIKNHENIHWEQQKEFPIFFYLLYAIEYIIKLFFYGTNAYYNLAAEREAYAFEMDMNYLKTRKRYAWLKYIFINPKINTINAT